jgi:hypothetical protein
VRQVPQPSRTGCTPSNLGVEIFVENLGLKVPMGQFLENPKETQTSKDLEGACFLLRFGRVGK